MVRVKYVTASLTVLKVPVTVLANEESPDSSSEKSWQCGCVTVSACLTEGTPHRERERVYLWRERERFVDSFV